MKLSHLIILLTWAAVLAGCQSAPVASETAEQMEMTFMAGYKPQANLPFVGVYVAHEKGFFDAEGLQVRIEHSPGSGQHLQLLAAGEIEVTTQDAAVLLKRRIDPGLPIVSFALIGQRGQQAYAALADSGMTTPLDWEGHLVGYKGTPPPDLFALIEAAGADVARMEIVNVGFDPRLLTSGNVDVYPVYKSNEPYLIRSWGYEVVLWDAADYGIPTLGLAYVTSDEIIQNNPEMLARFLRGALKGIEYASENVDEAVEITLQYTGPETDAGHMRFMLETELLDLESEITDEFGVGWQTLEQWDALENMLVDYGVIPQSDVLEQVFTNEILERAQP